MNAGVEWICGLSWLTQTINCEDLRKESQVGAHVLTALLCVVSCEAAAGTGFHELTPAERMQQGPTLPFNPPALLRSASTSRTCTAL